MKLADHEVESYQIYRSIICVKRRYHYQHVSRLLQEDCPPDILYLHHFSNARCSEIDYHLYLPSLRYHTDESGLIDECHMDTDDDAHQLVATAMILTNVVVSSHLSSKGVLFPNRFHDTLRGVKRKDGNTGKTGKTGNRQVDSFLQVKTYARATYEIDQKGHFGLQVKEYVHFTSPMRRYADVIVHRVLAGWTYDPVWLEQEVDYINQRSTLVKTLHQLYQTWKIGRHIATMTKPNTIWITGISRSGILWYLPDYSVNGFTHVSQLGKQYWKWCIGDTEYLQGTSSHHQIRVGQSYPVSTIAIDPITFDYRISLQLD